VLNAATGLLGAWRLIGLFAAGEQRMAGFLLLLLTPFYTFLCFKYNANTIFLSLWPWTLFAFLGSMDRKNSAAAIWFGVLLGLSFLSKYYALVLAGTCVAASLPHEDRGAYYRSARPWISLAAFTLCVLPHALWLAASTAPPIAYAEILVGKGGARAIRYAVEFLAAVMLYQVVVMAAIAAATRQTIIPWRRGGRPGVKSDPGANQPIFSWPDPVLATLVASPVVLTILLGLAFQLKISANMTVGAFPLAPLLLLQCVPAADPRRLCRIAGTAALALTLAPLAASPLVARIEFRIDKDPGEREPRKELAATATAL
jgi:hypothetical protein